MNIKPHNQFFLIEGVIKDIIIATHNTVDQAGLCFFKLIHLNAADTGDAYLSVFRGKAKAKQCEYIENNIKDGDNVIIQGKIRRTKKGYVIIVSTINKIEDKTYSLDDNIVSQAMSTV